MMLLMPPAFLLASASITTTNPISFHSTRLLMNKSLVRPSSTASFASSVSTTSKDDDGNNGSCKPRILCLHGRYQSGSIFSNKIGGARRKIAKEYDLDFLDGPILLQQNNEEGGDDTVDLSLVPRAWWNRSEDGKHTLIREAFDYVIQQTEADKYDAIIGFSQGGTLATALALSGAFPHVRAVLTAGAPYTAEAFEFATSENHSSKSGFDIPKLHLAGETDGLVPMESMRELCEKGGNGTFITHEQGHLFPTRSARVREMLDFLGMALSEK